MKRLLALVLILSLPLILVADEKKAEAKPNTLTPEEVRDGWLLLFDGETTFGWKMDGESKVEKGMLILGGEKATKAEFSTAFVNRRGVASCDISLESTWEQKSAPKASWKEVASGKMNNSGFSFHLAKGPFEGDSFEMDKPRVPRDGRVAGRRSNTPPQR